MAVDVAREWLWQISNINTFLDTISRGYDFLITIGNRGFPADFCPWILHNRTKNINQMRQTLRLHHISFEQL